MDFNGKSLTRLVFGFEIRATDFDILVLGVKAFSVKVFSFQEWRFVDARN